MGTITPDSAFSVLYAHVPKSREGRENYLTDCFALALGDDRQFAQSLLKQLIGATHVGRIPLQDAQFRVTTQDGQYDNCCLDLVIDVARSGSSDRKRIVIECKLGAPLGPQQLAKYMALPVWGVTVIAKKATHAPVSETGPQGARWLPRRPAVQLQWGDVHVLAAHRVAEGRTSPFVRALVGLLKTLHLDPPHPEIGQFGRGGSPSEQQQRRDFAVNSTHTLALLNAAGWPHPSPGKQAQIYSGPREGPRLGRRISHLLLDPLADLGRTLRVRLNGYSDASLEEASRALDVARLPHNKRVLRKVRVVKRASGSVRVLDVDVPMHIVLPVGSTLEDRNTALASFVRAVIKKAG